MTSQAAPPPVPALPPVAALLARLALAPRQTHKALTLWPLVLREETPACDGPGYVSLSRALEDGTLQIDEVGEGGSVPLVRVTNRGGEDVLFLFGEEIRGAKQNRIANASFLVPARSELVIDVSCVEQGRWARRGGGGFASTGEIVSHRMRMKMARRVAESRRRGARFQANQREVWQDIGERLAYAHTASATDSYEDYVRSRRADLSDMLAAFRPLERQVGFVAVAGDADRRPRGDRAAGGVHRPVRGAGALVRGRCDRCGAGRARAGGRPAPPRFARGLPGRARSSPAQRARSSAWETTSGSRARAWRAAPWSRAR